jgi:ribosomal-protein-alanine acetyltransferase
MPDAVLEIRHATPADLDALAILERASFPHDPWSRDSLAGCFTDERYLVLLLNLGSEPAGYLIGWHVFDEAELARVGVMPERRRGGLGQRLLDAALEEWRRRGVDRVFLDVRALNVAARALYLNRGFEQVGLRRGYYGDEDAILMALELQPTTKN